MKNFNIEEIVQEKRLPQLLLGENEYNIEANAEYDEPHNLEKLWRIYLIPYIIQSNKKDEFIELIFHSLNELLLNNNDINKTLYIVPKHLAYLYTNIKKNNIDLNIDTPKYLIINLIKLIKINENDLIADKRWSGAAWNKYNNNQGIYGSLKQLSYKIKEIFPEIDFSSAFE
jgi:hypothetical protein